MSSAVALFNYSAQEFLTGQNLTFADEVVASVFGMMLDLSVEPISAPAAQPGQANELTAIVAFSGSLRGACELRFSAAAARFIASAMLGGAPVDEEDEAIDDAVGELCNMVAGGWKNRIESLSSTCSLSPPTVISGYNYRIHVRSATAKLMRVYRFEGNTFQLTLHCLE